MTGGFILAVVLAVFLVVVIFSVSQGWVPPVNAGTLIRIREGEIMVERGPLRPDAKQYMMEILREAEVKEGWIAIMGDTRVVFSRRVPQEIHQRLRNVLLNQWG